MLEAIRQFLRSKGGTGVGVAVVLIGLVVVFASFRDVMSTDAESLAATRMFMDAGANPPKPFKHDLTVGESIPVKAPSGGKTGYPGEACYWNKNGTTKKDPTWVLLKSYTGSSEPTFCPDCGRLVVGHNPPPGPGSRPPPTQEEYSKSPKRAATPRY
jgi:hypothetical protein